jgi:putative addiction module killer protein
MVTNMALYEILEYQDVARHSPFKDWFDGLDPQAAAKINVALTRLAQGNVSNVKGVGSGVLEYRIDFGPGYRIYFGRDGHDLIILLGGGTKRRQQQDIETAIDRWADYKRRKKEVR